MQITVFAGNVQQMFSTYNPNEAIVALFLDQFSNTNPWLHIVLNNADGATPSKTLGIFKSWDYYVIQW